MNRQKFGLLVILATFTFPVWASHAALHSDGLFLDAETTRSRCGVGNYLFRHLQGSCGVTAEASNYETDLTPISQSVAIPAPTNDTVLFSINSAKLTEAEKERLSQIAEVLKMDSSLKVEVQGNADSVGTQAYNEALSRDRAASVIQELKNSGVKSSQISMKAFGESNPVADNDTDEGRSQNRRTDIILQ